jgi:imidazolonepropionase-like amidohydrolase
MILKTIVCASLVASAQMISALAADAPTAPLYVRCGKLMVSADEGLKGPTTMIVENGKITSIGVSGAVPIGARQLDLSRYTVVPGFIDSHVHLWTGPYTPGTTPSASVQVLRAQKAMEYALKLGVVGVRVLGASDFIDVALHDAIEEGTISGPHVLAAGYPLTIPGGHADQFTFPSTLPLEAYYTPLHGYVNSSEDAEKAVHLQVKYGAKIIKMFASGGVGLPLDSPDAEQLSSEEMKVIVEQAHMVHLKVAAHDENLKAILDALHAGTDSIEHASSSIRRPSIT